MASALHQFRLTIAFLLLSVFAVAGTPGSFRGVLFDGADTKPGWMYVVSRNDMLRLVNIKGAAVFYADEIPENLRSKNPASSLKPGAEVRVTAQEDGHGHWRAQEIEILNLSPTRRARK